MQAVMMFEVYMNAPLRVGDCRITGLSDLAAEYHGFRDAHAMLDHSVWLSDHQGEDYRWEQQWHWFCRNHGINAPTEYATVFRAPGGEPIGQCRRVMANMVGPAGSRQVVVRIDKVGQLPSATLPDLDSKGVSIEQVAAFCGETTIAKLRTQYAAGAIQTRHGKTFTSILDRIEGLSTSIFGERPGRAIDVAFSDLVTWTVNEKATHQVFAKQSCLGPEGCGRVWWSHKPARTMRCPSCAAHVRYPAALE